MNAVYVPMLRILPIMSSFCRLNILISLVVCQQLSDCEWASSFVNNSAIASEHRRLSTTQRLYLYFIVKMTKWFSFWWQVLYVQLHMLYERLNSYFRKEIVNVFVQTTYCWYTYIHFVFFLCSTISIFASLNVHPKVI